MTTKQIQEVASDLGSEATIKRYLKRAVKEGRIERSSYGRYQPSDYIPFDAADEKAA
jgi:predicted transcriptional regulator